MTYFKRRKKLYAIKERYAKNMLKIFTIIFAVNLKQEQF